MSLKEKIIERITTRDVLSVGGLGVLAYGVGTGYFEADAVLPVLAMVFAFWFGNKVNQ